MESSPKRACIHCQKVYTRKSDLVRHTILCEIVCRTEREAKIASENIEQPSYSQLCAIVNELAYKCAKMEKELLSVQKWTTKEKKKINVIDWLNAHRSPEHAYIDIKTSIQTQCSQDHVEFLFTHSLLQTIQHIFETNCFITTQTHQTHQTQTTHQPMCCFEQKHNTLYICDNLAPINWKIMTKDVMVDLLNSIYTQLLRELLIWRKNNVDLNQHESNHVERMTILFNETIIKLTKDDFNKDHTFAMIKSALCNYLKQDLKNMIEYDFE